MWSIDGDLTTGQYAIDWGPNCGLRVDIPASRRSAPGPCGEDRLRSKAAGTRQSCYSAFGLAFQAAACYAGGVQRGQTSALVGAPRRTQRVVCAPAKLRSDLLRSSPTNEIENSLVNTHPQDVAAAAVEASTTLQKMCEWRTSYAVDLVIGAEINMRGALPDE